MVLSILGRLNNALLHQKRKEVHILIPGICGSVYISLHDKKGFADVIKLKILITEDHPELYRWSQDIHKGPYKAKVGRVSVRKSDVPTETAIKM